MPTCNIDARGKRVRLIGGVLTTLVAVVLAIATLLGTLPLWVAFVALGTLVGGLFQIYEARAGWCVMRAMGFRTPI